MARNHGNLWYTAHLFRGIPGRVKISVAHAWIIIRLRWWNNWEQSSNTETSHKKQFNEDLQVGASYDKK